MWVNNQRLHFLPYSYVSMLYKPQERSYRNSCYELPSKLCKWEYKARYYQFYRIKENSLHVMMQHSNIYLLHILSLNDFYLTFPMSIFKNRIDIILNQKKQRLKHVGYYCEKTRHYIKYIRIYTMSTEIASLF